MPPVIPEPLFPGDDGSADPALLAALGEQDGVLVSALKGKRLFVAVIAQLVSTDDEGKEKESDMALAILKQHDQTFLPVFTDVSGLLQWRSDARPVQVLAEAAALQAFTDEMTGLLIDQHRALTGPALRALIFDFPLVPISQDPVVEQALEAAIALHEEIVTAWMEPGDEVDAVVNLLIPTLHSEHASRVAGAVASWLAADPNLRLRTSKGFDVQVVTAR